MVGGGSGFSGNELERNYMWYFGYFNISEVLSTLPAILMRLGGTALLRFIVRLHYLPAFDVKVNFACLYPKFMNVHRGVDTDQINERYD